TDLDALFAAHRFLGGTEPTVADLAFYGQLNQIRRDPTGRVMVGDPARPHGRWLADIERRADGAAAEHAGDAAPDGAALAPLGRGTSNTKPQPITTADCAASRYGGIYADVDFVMLGRRAQDSRIPREIPLSESGHHATPAGASDVQARRRPDGERVANPRILRKARLTRAQLHHDVWTKPPDFEAALRIQLVQAIERGRGQ